MSAGRPPTTAEGEVRRLVRRLNTGPGSAFVAADRITAMRALLAQVETGARHGRVDRDSLLRLSAHAQAWADLMGDGNDAA